MTPYLTRVAIAALQDGMTSLAWTTAALTRAKKLPKLAELLERKERRNLDDELRSALGMVVGKG